MRELGRIFVRVNWLGLTTIALGFALWEVLLAPLGAIASGVK